MFKLSTKFLIVLVFCGLILGFSSLTQPVSAAYAGDAGKAIGTGGGIGKPGAILSPVRIVDGKNICGKNNDQPQTSNKNPGGHIDSECCLDPDETPNSNCAYPDKVYSKYIQRYLSGLKE